MFLFPDKDVFRRFQCKFARYAVKWWENHNWGRIPKMCEAGFDSVFAYNSGFRSDFEKCVNPGEPSIDYSYSMVNQRYCWERIAQLLNDALSFDPPRED